jgi:hypothetical protein
MPTAFVVKEGGPFVMKGALKRRGNHDRRRERCGRTALLHQDPSIGRRQERPSAERSTPATVERKGSKHPLEPVALGQLDVECRADRRFMNVTRLEHDWPELAVFAKFRPGFEVCSTPRESKQPIGDPSRTHRDSDGDHSCWLTAMVGHLDPNLLLHWIVGNRLDIAGNHLEMRPVAGKGNQPDRRAEGPRHGTPHGKHTGDRRHEHVRSFVQRCSAMQEGVSLGARGRPCLSANLHYEKEL